MSQKFVNVTADELLHVAAQIAWRQWNAIGGAASTKRTWHSIVDPEALVLGSLHLIEEEPRIKDILSSWVEFYAGQLSVQRLKNLQKDYPIESRKRLSSFAHHAQGIAKHPRWRSLATDDDDGMPVHLPDVRRAARLQFHEPASLMIRLRIGMGTGVKADVLSVVLGSNRPVTIRELSDWLAYTSVAIRTSIEDLTRADFIKTLRGKPAAFIAPIHEWRRMLQLRHRPRWVAWHQWFSFVIDFANWVRKNSRRGLSDYALDVKVRELVAHHSLFFRYAAHELDTPALESDLGSAPAIMKSVLRWAHAEAHDRPHSNGDL
jgi:hypothetical protein